MGNKQFKLT